MTAENRQPPEGDRPGVRRLVNAGLRGADRFAQVTGVSAAVDEVIEEAIIRAFRSPAVRRAIERALTEDALRGRFEGIDIADVVHRTLRSQTAAEVWAEVLASDQAQMLVERIADAPEVRAAITGQGAGLVTDLGIRLTRLTEALDDAIERIVRPKDPESETNQAGLATRALAAAVDFGLLFAVYTVGSAALSAVVPATFGGKLSLLAIGILSVIGVFTGGGIIVAFWALVGQTPGMRFLSIRLVHGGDPELGLRLAIRRMVVLVLGLIPGGLGFLWIARNRNRRGWHDLACGTDVIYEEPRAAPYSRRPATRGADSGVPKVRTRVRGRWRR